MKIIDTRENNYIDLKDLSAGDMFLYRDKWHIVLKTKLYDAGEIMAVNENWELRYMNRQTKIKALRSELMITNK